MRKNTFTSIKMYFDADNIFIYVVSHVNDVKYT